MLREEKTKVVIFWAYLRMDNIFLSAPVDVEFTL